jgi:apolipoprotein N-acyltransferase
VSVGPELLLILAGVAQAASLAWPVAAPDWLNLIGLTQGQPLWYLPWLTLALLFYQLRQSATAGRAAWLAWCFATAWLAATVGWLFVSMHTYGGLAAPLAILAVLVLAGAMALINAAAAWLFWQLGRNHSWAACANFAGLWMLAEITRGQFLTGFGWGAVGYSQLDGPLAASLPWLGIYGSTALVACMAALLGLMLQQPSRRQWLSSLLVMTVVLGACLWLPGSKGSSTGVLGVSLLQGNIPQNEKFDQSSGVPQALKWYGQQLVQNKATLVVTPETALPLLPADLPADYFSALQSRFTNAGQAALIGMPMGSFNEGYTNSVMGLKPGQSTAWQYDKHHLVPFGEFIPALFRWFTNLMNIPLGDFNRGTLAQPTFDWQGQRLATSICYENLFSEELAAQFTDAALAPTVLVNLSNLGWFGEHLAMDQHLAIARVRTLEFDRPFLLATNTGHTAVVNHQGRVTDQLLNHQAGVLNAEVEGRSGITPYAYWVSRWGQWPLVLAALLVLAVAWVRRHS